MHAEKANAKKTSWKPNMDGWIGMDCNVQKLRDRSQMLPILKCKLLQIKMPNYAVSRFIQINKPLSSIFSTYGIHLCTPCKYSALPNNRAVTIIYLGIFSNIFIK